MTPKEYAKAAGIEFGDKKFFSPATYGVRPAAFALALRLAQDHIISEMTAALHAAHVDDADRAVICERVCAARVEVPA